MSQIWAKLGPQMSPVSAEVNVSFQAQAFGLELMGYKPSFAGLGSLLNEGEALNCFTTSQPKTLKLGIFPSRLFVVANES